MVFLFVTTLFLIKNFFFVHQQENLKKFREERKKLEEADALLKAREKFVSS